MERSRTVLAVLLVVAAVVGAFALLDFHAARAETGVEKSVSTASVGNATGGLHGDLTLHVAGDGALAAATEARLVDALGDRDVATTVVESVNATTDGPVLVVVVDDADLAYNPVTPSARVAADVLYVPSGNVTQFGRPAAGGAYSHATLVDRVAGDRTVPMVLDAEVRYVRQGTVTVTGRMTGVASAPAFRNRVADAVAVGVLESVESENGV
ncbi:hypothetical protein ACFQH6_01020 [Halobacteriaceae archaeon GCM10025711]